MGDKTQSNLSVIGESKTSPSLIRDMQAGDLKSFGRFYEKYAPWMCSLCVRYGLSPEDAEDLAVDLTVRLIERFKDSGYDPRRRFRSWLRVVTKNAVVDFWRKNQKVKIVGGRSLDEVASSADFTAQILDRLILLEAMNNVCDAKRVTARDLAIFELLTEQGCTPCEVANRFSISRGAVDNVKWRVVKALRTEIGKLS